MHTLPNPVLHIISTLQSRGEQAYLVGGSVRDMIMDGTPHDYDITTSATPQKVIAFFDKVVPTGIRYGTVTVMLDGIGYEVTTFRGDGTYSDGRRPDNVEFTNDIIRDLERRDFTINAVAYDPVTDTYVDPFNGASDIVEGVIRAVGNPQDRFAEDGLRILRALRFAARFGFSISNDTLKAIHACRDMLAKVSKERVRDEFVKMLCSAHPEVALHRLECLELLPYVCPEAVPMVGCGQNHYHDHDVWEHTVRCVMNVPSTEVLRLAAFFHDIGKPMCKVWVESRGEHGFYEHDDKSAIITRDAMVSLKFSKDKIDQVCHLVQHHMHSYVAATSDASIRRFIKKVGVTGLSEFFELRRADLKATRESNRDERVMMDLDLTTQFEQRCETQKDFTPKTMQSLPINGDDAMRILGLKPGAEVGAVLKRVIEHVLDHPEDNNREALLTLIANFHP
jgi:tRNA nucleotidyltransferase (CCA-adding enzyme)